MSKAYIVYEDMTYSMDIDGYWMPQNDTSVVGVFTTKELAHSAIKKAAEERVAWLVADERYDSKKEQNDGWRIFVNASEDSSQMIDDVSYEYYALEIELDVLLCKNPS